MWSYHSTDGPFQTADLVWSWGLFILTQWNVFCLFSFSWKSKSCFERNETFLVTFLERAVTGFELKLPVTFSFSRFWWAECVGLYVWFVHFGFSLCRKVHVLSFTTLPVGLGSNNRKWKTVCVQSWTCQFSWRFLCCCVSLWAQPSIHKFLFSMSLCIHSLSGSDSLTLIKKNLYMHFHFHALFCLHVCTIHSVIAGLNNLQKKAVEQDSEELERTDRNNLVVA